MKRHIVALTGAGISAESGLKTFRDNDGLWEEYSVYEVATPEAWQKNPALVLEFYNQRRRQLYGVSPNKAHHSLYKLEEHFSVSVVTQNVDDLHERAKSSNVLHLHGELKKARSTLDESHIETINSSELNIGDTCPHGGQLRPHVVWFGENVPMLEEAAKLTYTADILLVIGTSLNVYPAAGLVNAVRKDVPIYVVDPNDVPMNQNAKHIKKPASQGMVQLAAELIEKFAK